MHAMSKRVVLGAALVLALGAVMSSAGAVERVTFTKDVLPILQDNCQTCHRPSGMNMSGMVAPMSLMTYEEVRPWAKSIAKSVAAGEMPPWDAGKEFHGKFRNERILTDEQMQTIVTWVEQRAPRGNPKDAPEPIQFSTTGWNLGTPDLIVDFPEPYFVADEVEDLYHNVSLQLTKEQHGEDQWIKWIEFKPGSEVVHHIIGYAGSPDDTEAAASAQEGEQTRGMLGGNAPGTDVAAFQDGFGIHLPAEASMTFAMHYHKEAGPGTGVFDSSQMGIKFQDKDMVVSHPVETFPAAHGAFEIPPGADNWKVGGSHTFKEDTLLISMMPHMHLRGKAAKYTAVYPDGSEELLLDVPEYDFNWQSFYELNESKLLPAGTRVEMEFWFDNSYERGEQIGFDPERPIHFGGPTTDEMDLAWMTVAPAKAIDVASNSQNAGETGDE